jgi:hypothetical protein
MNESTQLIASIGALFLGLAAVITSIATLVVSLHNTKKITEIHAATNGLVEKLGDAREEKGRLEEVARQK